MNHFRFFLGGGRLTSVFYTCFAFKWPAFESNRTFERSQSVFDVMLEFLEKKILWFWGLLGTILLSHMLSNFLIIFCPNTYIYSPRFTTKTHFWSKWQFYIQSIPCMYCAYIRISHTDSLRLQVFLVVIKWSKNLIYFLRYEAGSKHLYSCLQDPFHWVLKQQHRNISISTFYRSRERRFDPMIFCTGGERDDHCARASFVTHECDRISFFVCKLM
jgi:hypothetical protein